MKLLKTLPLCLRQWLAAKDVFLLVSAVVFGTYCLAVDCIYRLFSQGQG